LLCSFQCHNYMGENKSWIHFFSTLLQI
jgi:hypothetical protein